MKLKPEYINFNGTMVLRTVNNGKHDLVPWYSTYLKGVMHMIYRHPTKPAMRGRNFIYNRVAALPLDKAMKAA